VHHTIEASRVLQEVVDTGHDTEDTKGEEIDTDNSNDTECNEPQFRKIELPGLSTDEPTEETEKGSDKVDDSNRTSKLP